MAHTRMYAKGALEFEDFPVADISEHLERSDTMVWVDLCAPSKEDLHELADELGLHPLAVEDALEEHQRPKLDRYGSHLFLSCHAVRLDPECGMLEETEIDAFVGERWLVTVRDDETFPMQPVLARWDRSADLAAYGAGYLLYCLLDVVVDGYFDTIQRFDDFYDAVSEAIFSEQPMELSQQRLWFQTRQSLIRFHRLVVPLREAVSALMRREHAAVDDHLYHYYQDVYDHILRVSEATDALRDLVGTIVETNLSLRDYRMNQNVRKITGWAAIIAVPTLITGWYGMNVPYPTHGQRSGVVAAALLVVFLSAGLFFLFKRKGWM
jgi:magnesium transporter